MKRSKVNGKAVLLINIILAQSLVVILNGVWAVYGNEGIIQISPRYITVFSLVAGCCFTVLAIFLINEILRLTHKEAEVEVQETNLNKSRELIDVLKSQRHDFLNHIQVVYGLAQMGQKEMLASYIGQITTEMEMESDLNRLSHVELAAFLIKKRNSARQDEILLSSRVESDLKDLNMPANELISICGNLIDNALFAVNKCQQKDDRVVLVVFTQDPQCYSIYVANKGTPIQEEIREKIFERGFTTKGDQGSGLGLHITQAIVEKYGGTVSLAEMPGFATCFRVSVPL